MLTRLKVNGFKNLVDVDIHFGPFTCIAGANGVGKSNLFDAIHFLSALANSSFIEAAQSVRDEQGRASGVRSLFHRIGSNYDTEMSFEAEMIVPPEGVDDLGQTAKATSTFLRYSVVLAYRIDETLTSLGSMELLKEELTHIRGGDASSNLAFLPSDAIAWRTSAVRSKRYERSFILTEGSGADRRIRLRQGSKGEDTPVGRTLSRRAANLPRTVLSTTNATENPTALLARREMESWRLLQLEPSSLRKPDSFTSPTRVGTDGSHLAATMYRLARAHNNGQFSNSGTDYEESPIFYSIATRLSELIADVRRIHIDRDERRELLTLAMTGLDGTTHPAQSLSDGTLRFLALAVLELDPTEQGVLCLEEPENGIHPARIPAILQLLQDIATDLEEAVGPDNPLRQVIVNTHSPTVVQQVPDDSLVIAELREALHDGQRYKRAYFGCLPGTWRERANEPAIAKGNLLAYLNPVVRQEQHSEGEPKHGVHSDKLAKPRRVVDRADLQTYLPLLEEEN